MAEFLTVTGPRKIEFGEVKLPRIKPTQVRIKTLFSGISSGTEMTFYRGDNPFLKKAWDPEKRLFLDRQKEEQEHYPVRLGYESVGRIIEIGSKVENLRKGDIAVTYSNHQSEVAVEAQYVYKLPPGLKPEEGLFLPLSVVAYTVILDARIVPGEIVAVFGMGVAGLLSLQLAKLSGARELIAVDLCENRLNLAKKYGADLLINPKTTKDVAFLVKEHTGNRGADAVVEISGSARALGEAIRSAVFNGRVIVASFYGGQKADILLGEEFHHNRIRLISSQSGGTNPEVGSAWTQDRKIQEALEVLPRLKLKEMITHRIPFKDAGKAYDLLEKRPEEAVMVILEY